MSFEISIPGDFRTGDAVEVSAFNSISWNLKVINFPNEEANHNYGFGVKIGIVDTGYYKHDELPIPIEVKTFGQENTRDENGHGTHVFGIVSSIAKNANYYICRTLGKDNTGSFAAITNAINYLVEKKVDIIQISIGGTKSDKALHSAIKKAYEKGIVIVCSAGNSGGSDKFYPGAFNECIATGSIDINKSLSDFSTVGSQLDVVAPGEDIVSTWINGGKIKASGTSQASPHVAGIIALIIDHYLLDHGIKPSVEQIKNTLYSNAIDMGIVGWDKNTGHGIAQIAFHKLEEDKKVDAPQWLAILFKVVSIALNWWLKRKLK